MRLRKSFFCLALGFVSGILLVSCNQDAGALLLQQANDEWVKGHYKEAQAMLKGIVEKYPVGPVAEEAFFRLGEINQYNLGNDNDAVRYYHGVLKISKDGPFSYRAQKNIAEIIEFSLKDYDQAVIEYQKLINDFDRVEENPDHQFRIASIFFKKQDYEQAYVEFQTLVEDYPETQWLEEASFKVIEILYTLGRCPEMYQFYDRFIKARPKSKVLVEMDFVIASCLEDEGRLKEAHEKFLSLEGRYSYPAILDMKLAGLEQRIAKKGKRKKRR